jgi:hypothetical protein
MADIAMELIFEGVGMKRARVSIFQNGVFM